ncbi:bactofilin family protein [Tichowtungia aerotolerans]|uniref:DUF8173 domain-containing protein n=1 Tax=Tichowtungia aerotolerans TaxID=2697043 RepID=A0A6P1MFF4_9BACT|nr:polymer-forming cytoskeletal protein [Tichowtungia aerotolerans]QHI70738.1 hypothetical protein GT409_15255 [Tichowtungia aerotolerans]
MKVATQILKAQTGFCRKKSRPGKKAGIAAFLFAVGLCAHAIEFVQTNQFIIPGDQFVSEETWLSAQSIAISGTVSNDLFATTQNAELSGNFHEDVWCIGDSIHAQGTFQNSARLISRTVQIQGTVYGPVMAVGNTVKIDREAVLNNGLLCMGENTIIEGTITGNVRAFAQRVTLGGSITGDLVLTAQEIVALPGTVINGDLSYAAPNDLVLPSSVILNGSLRKQLAAPAARKLFKANITGHFLFGLAALVTGLVFSGIFPRYTGAAIHTLRTSTGLCAVIGFAALVLMPMAAFLMLFTVIGFPLSILILLFYSILLYLSKIIVALWIGSLILGRKGFNKRRVGGPMALGMLVLYTLTLFSPGSFPINLIIILFGLGALITALFKKPIPIILSPEPANEIKQGD